MGFKRRRQARGVCHTLSIGPRLRPRARSHERPAVLVGEVVRHALVAAQSVKKGLLKRVSWKPGSSPMAEMSPDIEQELTGLLTEELVDPAVCAERERERERERASRTCFVP